MATVELCAVSKRHGQNIILDNLDLKVEKGEFIVVIGPSGCGKSTLLRLVTGLDSLSAGKILINNECVNTIAPSERNMAMVFQHYALYPHMTAYDNMAYGLKMRGMKTDEIVRRVHSVAELLNLTPFLMRKPGSLSGGQNQRVAMGRAMVRQPAVFLFDEPLSNLDTKLRSAMRYEIKKLHERLKTTCLYVTHDQTEAMTLASRVVVLNKGRIEQIASPQKLYQQPASLFVAEFTGLYPINLFSARMQRCLNSVRADLGFELPLPADLVADCEESVVIAIRPEHLHLTKEAKHNRIPVCIEFVDDLGADKMVQVRSVSTGSRFTVRASAMTEFSTNTIYMEMAETKANLYSKKTGVRVGGWDA